MLVIANPKRPVPRAEGAPGKAKRQGGRAEAMKAERTGLQNESERSLTRKGRKDGGFEAHQKGARCTKKVRSGWAAGRAVQGGMVVFRERSGQLFHAEHTVYEHTPPKRPVGRGLWG